MRVFCFSTFCFQAAVYGIGICAEFGGSAFRPHTGGMCWICRELDLSIVICLLKLMSLFISTEALSRLYNVIKHPNALDLDNAMAYDNAVSALGKICQFHHDSIDASQVSYAFLHHMFLFSCSHLNEFNLRYSPEHGNPEEMHMVLPAFTWQIACSLWVLLSYIILLCFLVQMFK